MPWCYYAIIPLSHRFHSNRNCATHSQHILTSLLFIQSQLEKNFFETLLNNVPVTSCWCNSPQILMQPLFSHFCSLSPSLSFQITFNLCLHFFFHRIVSLFWCRFQVSYSGIFYSTPFFHLLRPLRKCFLGLQTL